MLRPNETRRRRSLALNADLGHLDLAAADQFDPLGAGNAAQAVEIDRPTSRTAYHNWHGQLANPGGIAPMGKVREHVAPHQKKEFPAGTLFVKMAERVDRVVHPAAVRFITAHRERRISGNRQFQHFDALRGRRQLAILFVRRHRRGQKPYRVQPALLPATFRQQQMPVMHRIKSSAEDAESHGFLDNLLSGRRP